MNHEGQYDNLFEIDKTCLDEEWVNQPKLYFKYAEQLVNAREDEERATAELKLVDAELDGSIRESPGKYDLPEKTTEKMIASVILMQREHQEAAHKLATVAHHASILGVVVTTLDHRKKALEKLVDLHGQNYFSVPRASTETSREETSEWEKKIARRKARMKKEKEDENS